MLTIRLSRVGKKKQPQYRIVVQDKRRDPWSPAIEVVGHYNPRSTPKQIEFNEERVKHWISVGAQPSETIHNLLVNKKIIEGEKIRKAHITAKRAKSIAEEKAKAETPAA